MTGAISQDRESCQFLFLLDIGPITEARANERQVTEPGHLIFVLLVAFEDQAAQKRAREHFSAAVIVPRYEALYRQVCAK